MPELRLNMVTREWVIIGRDRGKRPEDFIQNVSNHKRLPEHLAACPFCPGNEQKTPNEQYRVPDGDGWLMRVVPNKFAVLSPDGLESRSDDGIRKSVNGVGIHEIIIESPVHNHTMATITPDHLAAVIRLYRDRFIAAYQDPRVDYAVVFKNHGPASGTTIMHPHSQIVGIPVTPLQIRSRTESDIHYFDETGACLFCRTIEDELRDGSRIVIDSDHFVAFVPYAALSPFHLWIFPKRHAGSFAVIGEEEIGDLAATLKITLAKVASGLDDPDFNYIVRSGRPDEAESKFTHWYLSIVPRVGRESGFELGSGIYINPLAPEAAAAFLRSVRVA